MADLPSGEIKLRMITEGDEKAAEGTPEGKPKGKTKEDPQIGGIGKHLSGMMKMMKKVNPVFDVSNIVVNLLRKSQVLMAIIEPFFDIIMAFVDTLLAQFVPLIMPLLKILAGLLPEFQVLVSWIQPFFEPISKMLETLAKWVTEGAKIIKSIADKFNIGKKIGNVLNAPQRAVGSIGKKVIGGIGGLLGFASGTKYVPQNMTAELHRGESVLTARETQQQKSRNNPALMVQNPQFTINAGAGTAMDAKVFGSMMYKEFTKKLTDDARRS